jgi:hypothetical protein
MRHVYNDGGSETAGYEGDAGDCVARAHRAISLCQWRESRKSSRWASLGAGGLAQPLPPPEIFS